MLSHKGNAETEP